MGTKFQGSEEERRALDVYIKLLRATETVQSQIHHEISDYGLTMSQFAALEALHHLGPMCLKDIGRKILKSGGNMTLVIDNLEKAGLVRRQRSSTDRRQIEVYLTDSGHQKIMSVMPRHVARIVDLMSALDPAEQERLGELTRKLGLGIHAQE